VTGQGADCAIVTARAGMRPVRESPAWRGIRDVHSSDSPWHKPFW